MDAITQTALRTGITQMQHPQISPILFFKEVFEKNSPRHLFLKKESVKSAYLRMFHLRHQPGLKRLRPAEVQ